MAKYDILHHKATLFGDMFGGTEIWSTGFALAPTDGGDEGTAPTAAEAQAIAEAFRTWWIVTANSVNSNYRLLGCKVARVNTEGKSDASLTQYYNFPTPVIGGGAVQAPVPQQSVVATLQTTKTRGAGSKGRMYLPGIGFSIGADGKITTTQAATIANVMKTFFDTVNASTSVPGRVALMSAERTGVPFRAAEHNLVQSVRVGTVYDTQRRRRNQLVEQYSSAVLA